MEKANEGRHAALSYDDLNEKYKALQTLIEKTMNMHQKVREDLEVQSRQKRREVESQEIAKKPRISSIEALPPGTRLLSDSTNKQTFSSVRNNASSSTNDVKDLIRENTSNESLASQIKETIKIEFLSKDSGTKRDYKLGQRVKFEHFYEFFSSELRTNDLLYVIDKTIKPPQNLNEQQMEKQKFKVREILINRIEQTYHSKVLHIQDPVEILEKLKEFKRCEVNVTSHSIRQQLYSIKYECTRETALQFWDKFEEIIRNYENLPDIAPLTEQEKRDAFYAAIIKSEPEVQSIEFMTRSQTGRGLTYDALKRFIIQAKANRGQITTNHPSSKQNSITSVAYARSGCNVRCFECDDLGHMKNECPRRGMGLRKCYECGEFSTHKAAECPSRTSGQRNLRRRGGCRGRKYDNDGSERFERMHSNNKRSFKARGSKQFNGGKNKYTNRQSNQNKENQGYRNNRYAKRRGYRGGYQRQRGASKTPTTSTPQADSTKDQTGSVNNNQDARSK
ncbi:uncharacterized protein LOC120359165 isoform X2 [Solenopsis invicta]|uniref:uncharacterized protein LOC120359165 isoform X2 n=1 Tax=Solenopsis invicta TaxID=13686 RepID=UPI00193D03D4|nr:uncharacterized protein LOC120359165 isoform X2 [Solenopsis invicta]